MLTNSALSVEPFSEQVKLMVVIPSSLENEIKEFNFGDKLDVIVTLNDTNETDFVSQINLGINKCDTEWFSILEIDDEYKHGWLESFNEYNNYLNMNHLNKLNASIMVLKMQGIEFIDKSPYMYYAKEGMF